MNKLSQAAHRKGKINGIKRKESQGDERRTNQCNMHCTNEHSITILSRIVIYIHSTSKL